MSILSWIILLFVALGVLQAGIWVYQGVRALYRKMNGRPGVLTTGNNGTAKVRTMKVGRYNAKSEQEDTPWDDLPKYCGKTGWFGFAKYKDVVVPNKHYYPSVVYMDTPLKQYGYDTACGFKRLKRHWSELSKFERWNAKITGPVFVTIAAFKAPWLIVLGFVFIVWFVAYLLSSATRASRHSAEHLRNLTKADWQEVYANVGKQMDHEQEVRIAYTRGRMTGWRY